VWTGFRSPNSPTTTESTAVTQTSPFMLDAGQNPRLGFEPIRESQLESLDNFVSRMAQATDEARAALVKAADDMARFYDASPSRSPEVQCRRQGMA